MVAEKIWTKEEIRAKLEQTDDEGDVWVRKAIVAIWKRQTVDEKMAHTTTEDNGVGFNGIDAEFLSSLAEFAERNGFLTHKQLEYGRKRILKYAGQLAKIANGSI